MPEKNIILLNMSDSIGKDVSLYTYDYINGGESVEWFFTGRQSMIPGTKAILKIFEKEKKKIDRIIVLRTKEAVTAYDFYRDEITKYLSEGCDDKLTEEQAEYMENNNGAFIDSVSLEHPDKLFVDIEVGTSDISAESIMNVISHINMEDCDDVSSDTTVNVYIDTQGGNRAVTNMLNAIITMTEYNNRNSLIPGNPKVIYRKKFAIKYKKGNITQPIYEVSNQYRINDLVSGMKAFLENGKANQLMNYVEGLVPREKYRAEYELVERINTVAEAIQISCPDMLDKALDELSNAINNSTVQYNDAYFGILTNQIEADYGIMLSKERTVIDTIEWCIRKGFTQQALTYIESKMPKFFLDNVVSISLESNKKEDISDYVILMRGGKTYITDPTNIYFEQTVVEYTKQQRDTINEYIDSHRVYGKVDADAALIKKYICGVFPYGEGRFHYSSAFIPDRFSIQDYQLIKKKVSEADDNIIQLFWVLHFAIKNERNQANHAAEGVRRTELRKLEKVMKFYLKLVKHISRKYSEKDERDYWEIDNQYKEISKNILGYDVSGYHNFSNKKRIKEAVTTETANAKATTAESTSTEVIPAKAAVDKTDITDGVLKDERQVIILADISLGDIQRSGFTDLHAGNKTKCIISPGILSYKELVGKLSDDDKLIILVDAPCHDSSVSIPEGCEVHCLKQSETKNAKGKSVVIWEICKETKSDSKATEQNEVFRTATEVLFFGDIKDNACEIIAREHFPGAKWRRVNIAGLPKVKDNSPVRDKIVISKAIKASMNSYENQDGVVFVVDSKFKSSLYIADKVFYINKPSGSQWCWGE